MPSITSSPFLLTADEIVQVEMASKGRPFRIAAITILFGTLFFSFTQAKGSPASWTWLGGLLFIAFAGTGYATFVKRRATKPGGVRPIERTITVRNNGLTIQSAQGNAELRSSDLRPIKGTTENILICYGKQVILIPKRAFSQEDDLVKARELIANW